MLSRHYLKYTYFRYTESKYIYIQVYIRAYLSMKIIYDRSRFGRKRENQNDDNNII